MVAHTKEMMKHMGFHLSPQTDPFIYLDGNEQEILDKERVRICVKGCLSRWSQCARGNRAGTTADWYKEQSAKLKERHPEIAESMIRI